MGVGPQEGAQGRAAGKPRSSPGAVSDTAVRLVDPCFSTEEPGPRRNLVRSRVRQLGPGLRVSQGLGAPALEG